MNRLMRYFAIATILMLAATTFAATMSEQTARDVFAKANAEYQQQRYAQARELYAKIINGGVRAHDLFYNMGNACARLGKTGEAVLYYERARKLDPRDIDVKTNLHKLAPAGNDPQYFVLARPFFWVRDALSLREWMAVFLTLYVVTAVAGIAYFLFPSRRLTVPMRYLFYGVGGVCALIAIFSGAKYYASKATRYSVVMKSGVPIYSGPSANFSQIISAPEGTKLRRLRFDDPSNTNWAHVMIMDGQKGFIKADAIAEI